MTVFSLDQLIDRAAQSTPSGEAVRFAGTSLTYGDLQAAVNGIARALIDGGVRRGDRVALYLPKRTEAIAAVYGIMRAGAAYVPIDPSAPKARAALIARDCSVSAIVTTARRASELLAELRNDRPKLCLLVDRGWPTDDLDMPVVTYEDATADPGAASPGVPTIDTDLAYILYTSGSTGVPKGVMLTHRHALTFVEWCAATIGTTASDRFSSHAPLHFDLSVFDLFVAAYGGASVSIVPQDIAYFGLDLARFIAGEQISVWYSVPSALMLITRAAPSPGDLRTLRAVVFAGEVYPTKHLRALRGLLPRTTLWNLYGPTETNVCTYYRVDDLPDDDAPIPIGRACENSEVFVVRDDGSIAAVGEEGELFVRGSAVMKGYWGRPDRTARSLVQNPLAPNVPELVYRTGDLVRQRSDGNFDFLGRRDHQIKSRGYRIELGEIESTLHAHPQVQEVAAVALPHEAWGSAIVAFVVPSDGEGLSEAALKEHAAANLPRYMIPAHIEVVNELPRTSTGKIDRQRLAEGSFRPSIAMKR